jgi:GntR family transcriptional regulator
MTDGTFPPGTSLPSEPELMARFRVSRNTVRRAVAMLEAERRVIRKQGSGTYVLAIADDREMARDVASLIEDLRRLSTAAALRLLSFEMVNTPRRVLARAPTFGPRSLFIERTRSVSDRPLALVGSYVTEAIATRLRREQFQRDALLVVLEEQGVRIAQCRQVTRAVIADSLVAHWIGVPPGAPLLRFERLAVDESGAPIEFTEITYPSELFAPTITMRMDRSDNRLRWQLVANS